MDEKRQEEMKKALQNGDPRQMLAALLNETLGFAASPYSAETVRVGDKIIIPEGANLPDVIQTLKRQYEREEQRTRIHVTIPVSPWDGAVSLIKAIERNLGVVIQKENMGGAHQIDIEVELGKTISVPWGSFELPGMDGAEVDTDTTLENGRIVFQCHVTCKRRYEERIRRLLDTTRDIAMKESLHQGKAFSVAFRDEDGDPERMPKPKFFKLFEEEPIFAEDIEEAIERNIFVPLRFSESLRKMGESLKRGILLIGDYGVGKTMLASHIAKVATESNRWTFIYVKNSAELPEALSYAQQYQPVVIFAEDIDRIAGLERTDKVNELLNQLDGVDSKSAGIMTILTTNHPENVNAAMMRPGRIDLALRILPPDAKAVTRMIINFARDTLEKETDLSDVSRILAGESPARVKETVNRAKLEAIRRTNGESMINRSDLEKVAHEIKAEAALFREKGSKTEAPLQAIADGFSSVAKVIQGAMVNNKGNGNGEDKEARV